jgi:hypothetical protein
VRGRDRTATYDPRGSTDSQPANGPFRDEGAEDVLAERRREREAEQAQTLLFAKKLRRPGGLRLLAGIVGTAAFVALVGPWRLHSMATPPVAPRAGKAACAALASRYQTAWKARNSCTSDNECIATPRGGYWAALDGCARFGPRMTSDRYTGADADAIAETWLSAGCARDYSLCASPATGALPPEAQCLQGSCRERPPLPIPRDWLRVDAGLFQFFGPPGLHGGRAMVDDGVGYRFEGPGIQLEIEYDDYAPVDIHPEETTDSIVVTSRTAVSSGGHVGTDVAFEDHPPDGGAPVYRRVLAMNDAPCQQDLTFSTCSGRGATTKLAIWATCDRPESCQAAGTVFQSIVLP